jgi:dihydroorotase
MSKFLAIGMSLPQVIDCVTANAADGLRLTRKGRMSGSRRRPDAVHA